MKLGGSLAGLNEAELEAYNLYNLSEGGIIPQDWHKSYKSRNEKLKVCHRNDIQHMRNLRAQAIHDAQNKKS